MTHPHFIMGITFSSMVMTAETVLSPQSELKIFIKDNICSNMTVNHRSAKMYDLRFVLEEHQHSTQLNHGIHLVPLSVTVCVSVWCSKSLILQEYKPCLCSTDFFQFPPVQQLIHCWTKCQRWHPHTDCYNEVVMVGSDAALPLQPFTCRCVEMLVFTCHLFPKSV